MILAQLPTINRKLSILEYKNLNITKNEKTQPTMYHINNSYSSIRWRRFPETRIN